MDKTKQAGQPVKKKQNTVFSDRLDFYMRRKGITNRKLAGQLYLSESAVSGYRTGYRMPNTQQLREICLALNLSADYLLGLTDVAKPL